MGGGLEASPLISSTGHEGIMQRRDFLRSMAAATLSVAGRAHGQVPTNARLGGSGRFSARAAAEARGARQPNILFIICDQWRFDWTSDNPNLPIHTPNLDRIAKSGVRFANAITPSPLCAPARACLASGVDYAKCGVPSNYFNYPIGREGAHYFYPVRKTFYTALRDMGYDVLCCGKMDLAKGTEWWGLDGMWRLKSLGFTHGINNACKGDDLNGYELNDNKPADPYLQYMQSQGLLDIYLADLRKRFAAKPLYAATFPTPVPERAYQDNWIGQNGLDLLDSVPLGNPWFLQVSFAGPHTPLDITARMEASVRDRPMPPPHGHSQFNAEVNLAARQNYTAMCENIDRMIGLYLDKLGRRGELDNTLIVASADHGDMLGDIGHSGKNLPFRGSVNVPLIIAGPGIKPEARSAALVSSLDLTATFLDFGNAPPLPEMDSISLRPVLEGSKEDHRQVLHSALGGWRMASDGRYKVIRGFDPRRSNSAEWTRNAPEIRGLPPLVFDLTEDPWEERNLGDNIPAPAQRLLESLS